jgi:endoglucanase Acf2
MTEIQQIIDSLQKIADNTTSSGEFRIALITAIAAISGTVIGAVATYLTTRLQINSQITVSSNELRANTVSKERLEWLNKLRASSVDVMADFEKITAY